MPANPASAMPCVFASFHRPSLCSLQMFGTIYCRITSGLYTWPYGVYPCQVLVEKLEFTAYVFFFHVRPLILDCSVLFTILCGNPFKPDDHVRYFPPPFTPAFLFFFSCSTVSIMSGSTLEWMVLVFKHHLFSIRQTVLVSGTGCQDAEGNGKTLAMWFLFHAALNSERCMHPWSKC